MKILDDAEHCILCVAATGIAGVVTLFSVLAWWVADEPANAPVSLFCAFWVPSISIAIFFSTVHQWEPANAYLCVTRVLTTVLHIACTIFGVVVLVKNGNTSQRLVGLAGFEVALSIVLGLAWILRWCPDASCPNCHCCRTLSALGEGCAEADCVKCRDACCGPQP
jgi:hypothetical protein